MTSYNSQLLQKALEPFLPFWSLEGVEDILMNRPDEVWVKQGPVYTRHEVEVDFIHQRAIAFLAASIGQQNVGASQPLLSCDLEGGTRLQAVLPPAVRAETVALAIRRPQTKAPTLEELASANLFSDIRPQRVVLTAQTQNLVRLYLEARQAPQESRDMAWMVFFREAVKEKLTLTMCGQVGSGKTHFGLALASAIPLENRIVTIQDADEMVSLPHENRVDLFFSKGEQGAAQLGPSDLVEASLRLAMQWLFLQELRDGQTAFAFMRARRSGHPGITTFHATSAETAFKTLALMVKESPKAASIDLGLIATNLQELIDIVIHFHRPDGRFRVSDVWFRHAERNGAE